MRKRVNWKLYLITALIIFILGSLSYQYIESDNVLQAPGFCTSTLPATISSSITLCGNIRLSNPILVTGSNAKINCKKGTTITKAPGTQSFDAITIAQNLNNVQIDGCNFRGAFDNVIVLNSGVRDSTIQNNLIIGTPNTNGIRENSNAHDNLILLNTIRNTNNAIILEGFNSIASRNTLHSNGVGVLTGTDPDSLTQTTPNSICSTTGPYNQYPILCSLPQNGENVKIGSNQIYDNVYGIITYGLDNEISYNNINSNTVSGIKANSIYAGSEINPNTNWLQEYFNSGVMIDGNTITENTEAGIILDGKSAFFWETSAQYSRKTTIQNNDITNNGDQGNIYSAGIIIGAEEALTTDADSWFYQWIEYTNINNNRINSNLNDGILLTSGNWMTDILDNEINNNPRNGITLGTKRENLIQPGNYPEASGHRFIYRNSILNNVKEGIDYPHGYLNYVILNEINYNNKGIYIPENAYGGPPYASTVLCNDLSFNDLEGLDYDAKYMPTPYTWDSHTGVYRLSHNRVLNNGADGIRYFIDSRLINSTSQYVYYQPMVTWNNHIEANGFIPNPAYPISGYGINTDGFFYHGFFANNFQNNNLGPARDSGNLEVENMWDEQQFEQGYDNILCKCGTPCQGDYDCGYYSGTCVNNVCQPPPNTGLSCDYSTNTANCYTNPNVLWSSSLGVYQLYYTYPLPYVPVGNNGLATIIPTSAAPPLQPTTCANHLQCITKSCENYPAPINNQQCGNGNFIPEPTQFTGYYQPPFSCPFAYYSPPYFGIFIPQPTPTPIPPVEPQETDTELSPEPLSLRTQYPEEMPEDVKKDRKYIEEQRLKNQLKPDKKTEK
jgi:hypothetical protein